MGGGWYFEPNWNRSPSKLPSNKVWSKTGETDAELSSITIRKFGIKLKLPLSWD